MQILEKLYKYLPNAVHNLMVTSFDVKSYAVRKSGAYNKWRDYFKWGRTLTADELKQEQKRLLFDFLNYVNDNSEYYHGIFSELGITKFDNMEQYYMLPIQSKEDIRKNLAAIYSKSPDKYNVSKTGGTTGKSLQVHTLHDDVQMKFALLSMFREEFGYKLGDKVAWFSGKSLLTAADLRKKRFWKYDWFYKIRYYSTFHLNNKTIKYYIDDLNKFQPSHAVGFPSSIFEIAKWGIDNNYPLNYKMTALFPTAETIVENEKNAIEQYFGGRVVDQYASSEGAPFILECVKGNLHMDILTGFFEVLDENNKPANEGELVFTSFTTHGTPLIRYAIKDRLVLSNRVCTCGNNNPLVERIEGRINDFIYSEESGKINLGNVSNCVKYVKGVIKFQICQDTKDRIVVNIQKDESYTDKDEKMFIKELRDRLGDNIKIDIVYVDDIQREASGKFRLVKNSLKL